MGETALVDSQIPDSLCLIEVLDKQGDGPSAAVWHYYPDAAEWRLLLAGPTFDALLPREELRAYEKIVDALNRAGVSSLTIGEIKIVRTNHPLLEVARLLVKTGSRQTVRAHFRNNTVNGIFIQEMIVLRSA